MALNWDEIQGRTTGTAKNNTTYKSTIDWDKIQGRTNNVNSKRIDTTKTPAYNLLKNNTNTSAVNALQTLNSATKAQNYNNVSQKSAVTTNNTSLPTQMSVTSATTQKPPVFKTLEEAQNYAKENNIKISNDNIEKMKQISNTKKLTNQIPKENIIELNEEDKDFYLSRNRLNIYKNEYELAENSLKRAEEKYNNSSGEEKEQALQELNKEKEDYQEKLKKYTTAVKYDEYFNPVGRHLRNIAGNVSQGVAYLGNYLNRTLDNNRNSVIGNTYDNIDAEALYKYLQNPNDVSLRMKGFNSLVILNGKARTSEHAKKLFEDLTSGNFKGDAKDLRAHIENLKVQDYEDNKIMKNTYDYVQTNDEIVNDMSLSSAEKTLYDAEKVISNMVPTIGAGAINPALGRAVLFANANESAFEEALKEGAMYNQAEDYGNIVGGIELGSEMLFDSTVGKAIGLGGLSSSEPYANYVGDTVTKTFGKTAGKVAKGATNLAGDLVGEGTEEVISEFANPLAKMATYNPNAPIATPEDLDNAFISSMLPTAILGGGTQAINSTYNALTDTTKNELPKSSNNQFQQQNNKVIPQQIENSNNANVGQNSLSNISKVENNNQYSLDKPSVLRQSVNTAYEQGFEIPENTITTLENIQNKRQGLNIEFDTSVKGNGMYTVNNDGTRTIKINPNSSRAIEFTVVHELGHDLKAGDSKSYNELRNFVLEYAKTKEGYKTAIRALGETYSKELGEGKFVLNDEATNDILGEAIGNQEFLNSLAQKQPNLFQRIYNWFKNVLFDGNNTGRTLEERRFLNSLQSKFIIAYNQSFNNTENSQTNYSIGGQVGMKNAIGNDIRFTRLENNLNKAQKMAAQGVDNEYIRQQTNWFQDKNGDWKFEFSDKDMSLKNSIVLEENKTYKLGELLEHDTLFLLYPQLSEYKVKFEKMGKRSGSYNRESNLIRINSNLKNNKDIQSTLIHEIQHAIQKIENFERGSNAKFSKISYYQSLGEIEADNTKNRYLQEQDGKLNRDLIPPESSKSNPKHSKLDNYLKNRTMIDKIKDGINEYWKDRGNINDSISEEFDMENQNENTGLVVRGRSVEGLEDSSSFSLFENNWQSFLDEKFDLNPNSTKTKAIKVQKQLDTIEDFVENKNESYLNEALEKISNNNIANNVSYFSDFYRNITLVFGEKAAKEITGMFDNSKLKWIKMKQQLASELKTYIVDELGIKPDSEMAKDVQMYGEKIINEAELKTKYPENYENIIKADKWFREKYDELVDLINLTRAEIYPNVEENIEYYKSALIKTSELIRKAKEEGIAPYKVDVEIQDNIKRINERIDAKKEKINEMAEKNPNNYINTKLYKNLENMVEQLENDKAELERLIGKRYEEKLSKLESRAQKLSDVLESEELWRGKRIPKRNDYYRHFQEMTEGFAALHNIFEIPANISSNLAGTSEYTKPKSKYLGLAQKRSTNETKYDAVKGFLNYIDAASYAINIDPFINDLRDITNTIKKKTFKTKNANKLIEYLEDFAGSLAGKTNPFDRPLQKMFKDRRPMKALEWTANRIKSNAVLGNINSSISQILNLPQVIGKIKNPRLLKEGIIDFASNIGKENSIYSESQFIQERYNSDIASQFDSKWYQQPKKVATWALGALDEAVTKTGWNAFYREALEKGIDNPIQYADDNIRSLVAGRGLGERTMAQESKIVNLLMPFTVETGNYWRVMRDFVSDKDFGGILITLVASWLLNRGIEKVGGSGKTFDLIDSVYDAITAEDATLLERFGRIGGEVLSSMPLGQEIAMLYPEYGTEYGLPTRAELFGSNDPTRYGTGSIFENILKNPVTSLVMPWGGTQLRRTIEGITAVNAGGDYKTNNAGEKQLNFPIDTANMNGLEKLATYTKAATLGKYSLPTARDYFNGETNALSAKKTQGYEEAIKKGISADTYLEVEKQIRSVKPDGEKFVNNERRTKIINIIEKQDLTKEQKEYLYKVFYKNEI